MSQCSTYEYARKQIILVKFANEKFSINSFFYFTFEMVPLVTFKGVLAGGLIPQNQLASVSPSITNLVIGYFLAFLG